ncbi:poly(R)-hydroxyalkanoic acid synthase, class III, PhaE subunit [Gloeothece citriformis PCC 7424]|uniref:Poly(3-hydroxyalkanoate) polymerase subunit PhaE n=1 Tax=Gloeothece citriformis (strain PCC 7424) TaxID=65393 RepID=B7KDE1_GLOC7|nr:class III poly(R)-hydroxyalkanoic acid synthase subunit PhaE [Gloeothece citriformis]ACK68961.1 poly(R)-hydroxyalkanoic acid synthase, class III, PhaE subunit [Gloeothece citriformis PCC 7424]
MNNSSTKLWTDTATELVDIWAQTGTMMWKSWFDLVNAVPTSNPMPETAPELKEVTQRFLDNRELVIRFLKLSVDAWKDIFPKIEKGDDWQQILSKSIEQMQSQLTSFSESYLQITKDSSELWKLYLEQMQKFNQVWADPLGLFGETFGRAASGQPSALIELNNLYWNLLYEESFGSLMQTPLLGLPREFNRKLLEGFEAWRNLYRASIDYQLVLGDIQIRSFEALMKKLVTLAEQGKPVKDWREFQTIWSQVADDVFALAFSEEKNLKIRGNFLNSLNAYRLQQQELMEVYLRLMNLPTRSEIDEVHKSIYELRKEVKSLKKIIAHYEGKDQFSLES